MSLSLVPAVRRLFPESHITWMCGSTVKPLLEIVPGVDEIIPVDEKALFKSRLGFGMLEMTRIWIKMAGRRFDLIVTGNPSPYYRLLSLTARAGRRRNFSRGRGRQQPVPGRYHGYEYARLVIDADGPEVEPARLPEVDPPLSSALSGMLPTKGQPLAALFPGGAKNLLRDDALRRWPLESYVKLAGDLLAEQMKVVILGGPTDEWTRASFQNLGVIDLIGRTSILDLAAVIGCSDLVVSHDTAAVHLAGLMRTPVLALFGPTNPHEKISPLAPGEIIWGGESLACRPCYDGRFFHDCRDNRCMSGIETSRVLTAAKRLLAESGG